MDKGKFIDEYLEAVEKASVIPNIYCSKPYLLANENIIPYSDNSGLKGFIEKNSKLKEFHFSSSLYGRKWSSLFFQPKC